VKKINQTTLASNIISLLYTQGFKNPKFSKEAKPSVIYWVMGFMGFLA